MISDPSHHPTRAKYDWAANKFAYAVAWGFPSLLVVAGFWLEPALMTIVWSFAVVWMGIACLINAARCGRTHCRYTGPYYLSLLVPIIVAGSGLVRVPEIGWWFLAAMILLGGKVIWLLTESNLGRYRGSER